MDVNATLARIRDYLAREDRGEKLSPTDNMAFADDVRALDEWLSRGGFPPREWQDGRA